MAKLTLVTVMLLSGISVLSFTISEYAAPQHAAPVSLGQYLLYKKCCSTFNWIENRPPRRIGSEFLGKRSDQIYAGSPEAITKDNEENILTTLAVKLCNKLIPTPLMSYYIHTYCWDSKFMNDLDGVQNSVNDIIYSKRFSQTIPLSGKRFKFDANTRVRGIGSEFLGKRARIGSEFLGKRTDPDLMKEPVDNVENTQADVAP